MVALLPTSNFQWFPEKSFEKYVIWKGESEGLLPAWLSNGWQTPVCDTEVYSHHFHYYYQSIAFHRWLGD